MTTSRREEMKRTKGMSNSRIAIGAYAGITGIVILTVGITGMVHNTVQPAFAMQSNTYQSGENDENDNGLSAAINKFTNNLIHSILEVDGLNESEQWEELSTNEEQISVDSEAGRTHFIIRSSSNDDDEKAELNSRLSTYVYQSQQVTIVDDVAGVGLEEEEDNFGGSMQDIMADSIKVRIAVDGSPFFWWGR